MRRKVLQTIRQYNMVQQGDRVLVGFSGGADSTALLTLLWQLRDQLGITVMACHLNHCLRKEESERDEAFVRTFCQQRGIPLVVVRADVKAGAAAAGQSVETYARKLRYQVFAQAAENLEGLLHGDCPDLPQGSTVTFWEGAKEEEVCSEPSSSAILAESVGPEPDSINFEISQHLCPDQADSKGTEPDSSNFEIPAGNSRSTADSSNFEIPAGNSRSTSDSSNFEISQQFCSTADRRGRETTSCSNLKIPAGNSRPTPDHRGRSATSCSNFEISIGNFKIATAHTLNDNAETLLFYLARGTGLNGLGGIPPVRDKIIRPLIDCSREEIEQFCAEQGLDFVHDSTNDSDDYTRNYIRHRLLPLMQGLNPSFLQGAQHLSRMAREENDLLQQQTKEALEQLTVKHQPLTLSREGFLQLHPALRHRVLLWMLTEAGIQPDFCKVQQMEQRVCRGSGKTELRLGVALCADRRQFWMDEAVFYPHQRQPYFEQPFAEGTIELFCGKSIKVTILDAQEYKLFFKKDPSILKNAVDCDKMKDIAVFRQRKDGDRMTVCSNRGANTGSRPLKKMWIDAKIPQTERWKAAVLSDSTGVLWAEGFGCDRHAAPDEQSRRIALIRVIQTPAL